MIRFANEHLFFLLALLPLMALFYALVFRWKRRALARFGNLDVVSKLMQGTSRGRQITKAFLVCLATLFLVLSIVRPQIGTRLEEVKREGVDIFVALDVSKSMLAEDIKPSRLAKAKHEVSKFIDLLQGDRIGLISFAGEAFVQCPLTLDYGAAKTFLEIMDPQSIPTPGTKISAAIEMAMRSFETKERKYKVLVLITDGEDHGEDVEKMTGEAEREGVVIYCVGIGSPEGVPIPEYDDSGRRTGFKKDRSGQVVMTKLDDITLQKIALQTSGKYYQSVTGETKLEKIYEEIFRMEKRELASMKFSQYEDRFQYFLCVALVLFLMELLLSERVRVQREWRGRFE